MRSVFLLALLLPGLAWALPNHIVQEGVVINAEGDPVEGRHDIRIRLYELPRAGEAFWDERHRDVDFFEGYYAVVIGGIEDLDLDDFRKEDVYVGVTLDNGDELTPRLPLRKVPAAFTAQLAFNVIGDIEPRTVGIDGIGEVINNRGEWVGAPGGLRGPQGAAGAVGPRGPAGPAGPPGDVVQVEGADGFIHVAPRDGN